MMKKTLTLLLVWMIVLSSVWCVSAAEARVLFSSDSGFRVGETATVDKTATAAAVMDDTSVMADLYNAALEGNLAYVWICSNGRPDKTGRSVTWEAADAGCEYICRVGFYQDSACMQLVDYIDSEPFTVSDVLPAEETTITPEGPFYLTVGVPFEQQMSCDVSGATLAPFRTSLPKGLEISPDGLISGTPTEEGFCYTTIAAYLGDEMIGGVGVEFHVSAAQGAEPPTITTSSLPNAQVGQAYSVQLVCTDPNATFEEWQNPGQKNELGKSGLTLSANGELTGTPTKAGSYTFTVCACGDGGEGYMTYTLIVEQAAATSTTTSTTASTTADTTADATQTQPSSAPDAEPSDNVLLYVAIGLGVLLVCAAAGIAVRMLTKKK